MIEINGYKFKDNEGYLSLEYGPNNAYHNGKYIDNFFQSLGINREIFSKQFNITNPNSYIFPEYNVQTNEVVSYLQSLVNYEPNYEVY